MEVIFMEQIYLDNASTTFPKPGSVPQAIYDYITGNGANINRGCYNKAYSTSEKVYETRDLICKMFGGEDCRNVVFTKNVTESLNVIIKGLLKQNDHVLVSSMEHNAVMRPLVQLKEKGISFTRIPCDCTGQLLLEKLETCLKPNTRAVIMTHASNVCGTILPIEAVGEFCRMHNLFFVLDCAQTGGIVPVNMKDMNIDAIAFTGHKGLLGPQGIGGFLLREKMFTELEPLISGGTGSMSHTEDIPGFMPDRFEPGTMNLPGILGLREGLLWIEKTGINRIYKHELELTNAFLQGLLPFSEEGKIRILGRLDTFNRTGVVSIQTKQEDISKVAFILDEEYGIQTRVGLHCAPSAHKTLGSYPTGSIRFSFGWWNTLSHVEITIAALKEIIRGI